MKWARRILICSLIFAALVTGLWWEENWRGQKMWEESCARLRAAGEPVEIADIIPPMVPDEENVAAAPIFAELIKSPETARLSQLARSLQLNVDNDFKSAKRGMKRDAFAFLEEYRNELRERFRHGSSATAMSTADEVLHYLKKWDAERGEVLSALQRPKCRWPLDYENGVKMESRHHLALLGFTKLMRVRLLALAAKGDADEYTQCLLGMMKLERTVGARPESWLAQLTSSGISMIILNSWQQTLACVQFDDVQLSSLQEQVSKYSLESVRLAMQNERVISTETFRKLSPAEMVDWMDELGWRPLPRWDATEGIEHSIFRVGMLVRPKGWTLAEAAIGQDFAFNEQAPCVDVVRGIFHPAKVKSATLKAEMVRSSLSWFSMGRHAQNAEMFPVVIIPAARVHATTRMATLWCAIERYRLRVGKLPVATNALVPEFLPALPVDVMDGSAIRFTPRGDSGYILHSSGWSTGRARKISSGGPTQDDWVWASNRALSEGESDAKPTVGAETGRRR